MTTWEVTEDDVLMVLTRHKIKKAANKIDKIMYLIDCEQIERAAQYGNDIDEQTGYALEEIERQMIADGFIPESHEPIFRQ